MVWTTAQVDPVYMAFWMLPVTAERIFDHINLRLIKGAIWTLAEYLLVYLILAAGLHQPPAAWAIAVLCAALQAAFSIVLTFVLVACRLRAEWILFPILMLAALFSLARGSQAGVALAKACYACNPAGWANGLFLEGGIRGRSEAWWYLLPVLAVSASLPFSFRSFRRFHFQGMFRTMPLRRPGILVMTNEWARPEKEDSVDPRGQILTGEFLRPLPWNRFGLVERLIERALNAKERLVTETLLMAEPYWSKRFTGVVTYFALYLCANAAVHFRSLDDLLLAFFRPDKEAWAGLVGLVASFVLFVMMTAQSVGLFFALGWPETMRSATRNQLPLYRTFRLYPMNYCDSSKAQAKIATLVFLLLLPLSVLFSLTPAFQLFARNAPHGVAFPPKALILAWGFALLPYSTNLTPSISDGFRHWKSWLGKVIVIIVLPFIGFAFFVSPTLLSDLLLGILFVLGVLVWFTHSGLRYLKGPFRSTGSR
jgi:hypothetical protein